MTALVETGKTASCQLPRESAGGASLAVRGSEAAPEVLRTLAQNSQNISGTELCRVAIILLGLNLDKFY